MTSAVASQKLGSRAFRKIYDHDPGATTAVICSGDGGTTPNVLDMSTYARFGVLAMVTIPGGGALTKLEIVASEASDMSSPEVIKDSGTIAADAVEDQAFLECNKSEVAKAGADAGKKLRYVAARLTMSNATAEAAVLYEGHDPRFPQDGLTPATDIA